METTVQDVLRVLEPIWLEKTETTPRLRGRIENVLSWATVAGHRSGNNPARWKGNLSKIRPKPTKVANSNHQPALALGGVPRWWVSLEQRDGMAARALRFLRLTAAHSGEVRGMTWDELDIGEDAISSMPTVWSIPAARMKNGKLHRVPLTEEAVTLLDALPRFNDTPCFQRLKAACYRTCRFRPSCGECRTAGRFECRERPQAAVGQICDKWRLVGCCCENNGRDWQRPRTFCFLYGFDLIGHRRSDVGQRVELP
ncbi:tyrosine-type recombinase/integrase [Falsihalocynthiibacter sp. BN13B15]|uniref:tyrosine-type recombinase/integrase n=1 Tax=Falsihalocynthiibacter sp. BN13B15 TaxID=3240871 RepID=UPI00350FB39E